MKPMIKIRAILCFAIVLTPVLLQAETHKKVQAALGYQVAENTCMNPSEFANTATVSNAPVQSSGSVDFFTGGGAAESSDMDSYTRKRLEKKEKKWRKCVDKYKASLLDDMIELKKSAQYGLSQDQATQYGLSQDQANIIAGKMLEIQTVYMTPDGVLDTVPENE